MREIKTLLDLFDQQFAESIESFRKVILTHWHYLNPLKEYSNPIENFPLPGSKKKVPIFAQTEDGRPILIVVKHGGKGAESRLLDFERLLAEKSELISIGKSKVSMKHNRIRYLAFNEILYSVNEYGFNFFTQEEFKRKGHSLIEQGIIEGVEMVAQAHFDRSRQAANGQVEHPPFSEYMQHWIYSIKNGNYENIFEMGQIASLIQKYGLPDRPKMKPGTTYWSETRNCYY